MKRKVTRVSNNKFKKFYETIHGIHEMLYFLAYTYVNQKYVRIRMVQKLGLLDKC
jgi:hypothetical protein